MRILLSRAFRRLSKLLAKTGGDRVIFLINIYRYILRKMLPKGKTEISVNSIRIIVNMERHKRFGDVATALMLDGTYEAETTRCFYNIVKRGMKVVDVGANIGYYTLISASLVGSEGKVWAFEPEHNNFMELSENVRLNKYDNVVLYQKAVSDKDGMGILYLSKDSGGNSLSRMRVPDRNAMKNDVEIVKLDSIIKEKVDVLKTDTEGNEVAILRGAEDLLARNKDIKLIVESEISRRGNIDAIAELLYKYGFDYLYFLNDKKMVTKRITPQSLKSERLKYKYDPNILCSRSQMDVFRK